MIGTNCAWCGQGIKTADIKRARKGDESKAVCRGPDVYHTGCFDLAKGNRDREFGGRRAAK